MSYNMLMAEMKAPVRPMRRHYHDRDTAYPVLNRSDGLAWREALPMEAKRPDRLLLRRSGDDLLKKRYSSTMICI